MKTIKREPSMAEEAKFATRDDENSSGALWDSEPFKNCFGHWTNIKGAVCVQALDLKDILKPGEIAKVIP